MKHAACVLILLALCLPGCSSEVGSNQWCRNLEEKPSSEVTVQENEEYTRLCMLKPPGI